tara:strand:+ start:149 stop:370 length:222 start_codon:yes stop_codon:yes gene_type:complete
MRLQEQEKVDNENKKMNRESTKEDDVTSISWYDGKGQLGAYLSIRSLHENAKVVAQQLRQQGLQPGLTTFILS